MCKFGYMPTALKSSDFKYAMCGLKLILLSIIILGVNGDTTVIRRVNKF